ncbi:MAG: ABC transporter ATP-binding protein/permease [Oscillospiraceae bacterium]|nr:ABC transporter ATP-binding protein/permease [Oscillospiraceae bacterium]
MENNKSKKVKEPKKKPPYSVWQNLRFVFVNLWKWDKPTIFLSLLRIPVNVLTPLIGIYLSKSVVAVVTQKGSVEQLLLNILIFSIAMLSLNIMGNITNNKIQWKALYNRMKYINLVNEKYIDADYDVIENPDNQNKWGKAMGAVQNNSSGTEAIVNIVISILSNITGFISYAVIIFTFNPLLAVILAISTIGNFFAYKAMHLWEYRNRDKWAPIDRKLSYIQQSSGDFSRAKDIRLYNISEWFKDLFKSILKERLVWVIKYKKRQYAADIISVTLDRIRDVIAYGYLIHTMLNGGMTVANFVLYFGIIGGFSGWLLSFMWDISTLKSTSLSLCDMREFLDMPDNFNRGKGIDLPIETCEIEFKNVNYKYPGSDKYTIENLNFKIKKGEKIAIVGVNGAGKTTLIKLMCGLYRPESGEALVNGKNIMEYNRDEYYTLLSVVFQDIYLMPVSIAKNISLQNEDKIDKNRIYKVLELAGLSEKVKSLAKGADTLLVRSFSEEAIELSGGEKQKLALARALYKNGKIIVLDEPTAALDPIAESEMYQKYDELTAGRTAIYISHRLSSTRFCDRIFFLEDGKITETGNHYELMKKGGKYAEMFDIQSHYYKENIENTEGAAANV